MDLRAEVYNEKQLLQALSNTYIEKVYVPYQMINQNYSDFSEKIVIVPPVFLGDCEEKIKQTFFELKKTGFNNALAHSTAHIELFSDMGLRIFGGYRLNCANSESALFFSEMGVEDIIVSPELTFTQINNLKCDRFGFIAYGYLPLMITRRCPVNNGKPCNNGECCHKTIVDRKGRKLNVICTENTVEILNSDVLYLADKLNSVKNNAFAVLKFTVEHDVNEIIDSYVHKLPFNETNYTRGLYFRGIKE